MSITDIRNKHLACKKEFNLSVAESITNMLSSIDSTTSLDDDLDIVLNYDANRRYNVMPLVRVALRLNQAVVDIVADGNYGTEVLFTITLTREQMVLYNNLTQSMVELTEAVDTHHLPCINIK